MPVLVHLVRSDAVPRVIRNGIRRSRARGKLPAGVFAMPVSRRFHASHQWLRELKRSGARSISAVYFRVPDEEPVWFGPFGREHVRLTAGEAAGRFEALDAPEGYEILLPRRVEPREIVRARELPQVIGWRYYPGAHGARPCGCPACLGKGEIRSRAIRERYERGS